MINLCCITFNLGTIDWVAIGAVATLLMVIVTWCTLRQNRKQLNELKRQWEEENRPSIEVYFLKESEISKMARIEILNIGKRPATNITFHIDEKLVSDYATTKTVKEALQKIGNDKEYYLLPEESQIFELCKKEEKSNSLNDNYTIAGVNVDEVELTNFINFLKTNQIISIIGNYNNRYCINETIGTNNSRDQHLSLTKCISDMGFQVSEVIRRSINNLSTKDINLDK